MRQQGTLGCRGQPILLGHADWFFPSAAVRWRVDTAAGEDQVHRHRERPA